MSELAGLFREVYFELYNFGYSEQYGVKLKSLLMAAVNLPLDASDAFAAMHLAALLRRSNDIPTLICNRTDELEARLLRQYYDAGSVPGALNTQSEPWANAEEMFGENNMFARTDGTVMTLDELKQSGLSYVDVPVVRPTDGVTAEEYNLRYSHDGSVEKIEKYKVQPKPVCGDDELWNDFTQKFLNDIELTTKTPLWTDEKGSDALVDN